MITKRDKHVSLTPRGRRRTVQLVWTAVTVVPLLTVYYLGVPDTTPEFPTQHALGRYLTDRLTRERAIGGTK